MFAKRGVLSCLIAALMLPGAVLAQDGVSSAGAARARFLSELGMLPSPDDVSVEDFVNYHRHEIGRPKAGEAVALDLRWGSQHLLPGEEAVLQIGYSTALADDRAQLRPVNLALVIDKSGSMASANKMTRVKEALASLVSELRSIDTLSIVVFDTEASVLLPAQKVTNPGSIKELIGSLQPGSSTNINAGLELGYQEALKHLNKDHTNRVILLTDGIANVGVTEPKAIADNSVVFNDRGVDLSTIGVGLDLNKDLLRELAKSGRGLFHFVADAQDIDKVFSSEVQSLISPVAQNPNLTVDFGANLKLNHVYGYEPKTGDGKVEIKMDNLNSGATGVVLMRFRPGFTKIGAAPVKVTLSYYDLEQKRTVTKTETTIIPLTRQGSANQQDASVRKNYAIARLAQSMKDMAQACASQSYREAETLLNRSIDTTREEYPNSEDEDIARTLAVAEGYQKVLRKQNAEFRAREEENIIPNGNFAQGNTGFMSGLSYLPPVENGLWPAGYTIAPSWNQPLLHRLFAAAPYESKFRPNGNEQVFYANAGGTSELVLWSTVVQCKPKTRYRISFQSISLNGTREHIPNYEIRINGKASAAQPAGFGDYREISMVWESGDLTTATVSIVRMPMDINGGLIAISNIEMIPG